eukprot:COSAG01_NODE_40145_length_467_cov_0.896739_1_plen_42_part_10
MIELVIWLSENEDLYPCVLISFIHNLGLTIKPIKGPPQGVYA